MKNSKISEKYRQGLILVSISVSEIPYRRYVNSLDIAQISTKDLSDIQTIVVILFLAIQSMSHKSVFDGDVFTTVQFE
jgi:hypothetical protein